MTTPHRFALSLLSLAFASGAFASIGDETARHMAELYQSTAQSCADAPAFACSGILLRTTRPSPHYHTWNNSPNSRKKGGVAFSYLRADARISGLAEDARSGYTLKPVQQRATGELAYQVLCAYPTDGDSWTRDEAGCGDNSQTDTIEQRCHQQGIDTAEQWIAHYQATPGPENKKYFAQCAFDVAKTQGEAAVVAFNEALRAMNLLPNPPFPWNEIILQTWDESRSSDLPVQSFFHISGLYGGLQQAQHDQRDWYETTGKFVPIIEITLPQGEQDAEFRYRADDQAVPEPS
ncbi:halovibrin HvnA [Pseudomonas sp. nanlin1]|uniref:halovibrin HvnA n=1 Tax=Pseudomonas sp. nanlin1 TaxID=3040605 RepID=UPI00388F53DB